MYLPLLHFYSSVNFIFESTTFVSLPEVKQPSSKDNKIIFLHRQRLEICGNNCSKKYKNLRDLQYIFSSNNVL